MWIVNDFGLFNYSWHNHTTHKPQASSLKAGPRAPPAPPPAQSARENTACVSRCPLSCVSVCCVAWCVWGFRSLCAGVRCVAAWGGARLAVPSPLAAGQDWEWAKWAVAGDTGVRAATRRPFYAGRRRPRAPYTARAHPKATNHTAHR